VLVSVGPGERVSKDFHDGAIDAWRQYFLYLEEVMAGRRSSGAVGQWGREEEQWGRGAGRRSSGAVGQGGGAVGQWGGAVRRIRRSSDPWRRSSEEDEEDEEEQIGAVKGCEYPSIGQSD